jgi:hypothetical protein
MTLRQTVNPNYGIGATRGWCLQYVDDAISAPNRTYSAQAAYESAKARGWVRANTDMPRGLWSILFWSIDNGEYAGLGHVALVYVNDQGQMAIHDSEVHAGARQPYGSLQELANWFGSAGTRLTFLGWSIGVDGRQIIEDYTPPEPAPVVTYIGTSAHVQSIGWKTYTKTIGTTGKSLRLEAFVLPAGIEGEGHIEELGWTARRKSGEIIGTTGNSKRLEAIKLYGNIKYRVHVQDNGWTGWVDSGQVAGTTGQSKRIEAIEIIKK